MFAVTEPAGAWRGAAPLRGKIPLSSPADTQGITALTCTAPGQCTAVGAYGSSANSTDGAPVVAVPFAAAPAHGPRSAIPAIPRLPPPAAPLVASVSRATPRNTPPGRDLVHQP